MLNFVCATFAVQHRYLSRDEAKPVCLGVATQKDTGIATDNIGFLVPAGTVRRFLQVGSAVPHTHTHTHTHTHAHTRARAFSVSGGVVVIISSLTRLSHAHCFLSQNMSGCVRVWPLPRCSLAWVPMDVTGERSASKASLARPRYERGCAGHRHPNVR